jgi:tetratricopeptide (TPR) repeat protein
LAYHGKGQQEDALRSLIRGESANPFDPEIPYARATILLEMGRLEEAQRAARRCLEITPNFEAARTLLNRTGGF